MFNITLEAYRPKRHFVTGATHARSYQAADSATRGALLNRPSVISELRNRSVQTRAPNHVSRAPITGRDASPTESCRLTWWGRGAPARHSPSASRLSRCRRCTSSSSSAPSTPRRLWWRDASRRRRRIKYRPGRPRRLLGPRRRRYRSGAPAKRVRRSGGVEGGRGRFIGGFPGAVGHRRFCRRPGKRGASAEVVTRSPCVEESDVIRIEGVLIGWREDAGAVTTFVCLGVNRQSNFYAHISSSIANDMFPIAR